VAPAAASATAVARPMPDAAPVTTATVFPRSTTEPYRLVDSAR
jgi:hypothetical protein